MKTSFAVVCFLFAILKAKLLMVAAKPADVYEFENSGAECIEEFHLDENKIIRMTKTSIVPEDDADFNIYMGCNWQKRGLQNPSNGNINFENVKKFFQNNVIEELTLAGSSSGIKKALEIIAKAVDDCKNNPPKGESYGQTVVKVYNCITKKYEQLVEEYLKYT